MEPEHTIRPVHGGNLDWAASVAECSPNLLLDFSASISPLGPPPSILAAIAAATAGLVHYPNPNYSDLRHALAAAHNIDPDWILPGNGAAELLTWAGRDLASCAVTCLPTPAFGDYGRALKAFGGEVLACPLLDAQGQISDRLAAALARPLAQRQIAPNTAGLVINTPHNPTGQLWPSRELRPLLGQFKLVVLDEAFMDFLPPAQQQSLIEQVVDFPNLVVLRSLTKFYSLPGLRLGYAVGHPDRLRRWQQWRDPWPVNALAAAAAAAALSDRAFQQRSWDWLQAARPPLLAGLSALPGLAPLPGAANYLLVRTNCSVVALQTALLQRHRILIRDCLSFADLGDRYFRVAVRTEADNQRLLAALADVLPAAAEPLPHNSCSP